MIYCKDCKFRTASNLRSEVSYCAYYNTPIEAILGCESGESKIITNADRFRANSDEELADFLCDIGECGRRCPAKVGDCIFSDSACRIAWLDWLKQECKES